MTEPRRVTGDDFDFDSAPLFRKIATLPVDNVVFAEGGETVVVPRTDLSVNQGGDVRLATIETGVTLQDLVTGLNSLGMQPRDIITIIQAIKAAGALQAEIEVM